MPRAPVHFTDTSQAEQYHAPDSRTWNGHSSSSSSNAYAPRQSSSRGQLSEYHHQPSPRFMPQPQTHSRVASQPPRPQMQQSRRQMPPPTLGRTPTQIDDRPPDYWHENKHLMCVNRGLKIQYPHSISFRPTTGPCTFGVALLNLEYARGMIAPDETLDLCMPPSIMRYESGAIHINWPGYRQESFVLTLINPRTGRHVTRADLGAQATQIFKDFANSRKESDFTDGDGAMCLGVDGVMYDQVRLVELYTKDGMSYHAQWGLNAHYLAL
ncbi:hypothetical protein C8R46DRAFT_1095560 [Mycena filopes]|nr:hypothetical protein C8R46DRAFT_1095560 [Mycena filopes]